MHPDQTLEASYFRMGSQAFFLWAFNPLASHVLVSGP